MFQIAVSLEYSRPQELNTIFKWVYVIFTAFPNSTALILFSKLFLGVHNPQEKYFRRHFRLL